MKKTITMAIIAIFLFSIVPFAFADEADAGASVDTTAKIDTSLDASCIQKCRAEGSPNCEQRCKAADLRANKIGRLEEMKEKNRERLQKIADLDQAQIGRLTALNVTNIEKIALLKKERLERLAKLSEEKLKRIAELDKDKLEKVTDLSEEELNKLAVLNRANLKRIADKNATKLRAELKSLKVMKIRNADDLNKRKIPETALADMKKKFENAKEMFIKAKDGLKEERENLKAAKEKGDEQATLEHAKKYLLNTADALITHLEKIKAKVQESANIDDAAEAKITAQIDAQISEINTIKTEIEAATTKEQIREAAKKLRAKWGRLQHLVRLHSERVVAARVEGLINRATVLEKKLDNVLEKAKEKGIEVDVSAELSQFSEKVELAREKYKLAQDKLSMEINLAKEVNQALKESRDALKEAHDILKTIVKKIKEAVPDADLSAEVEVEVAQET